MQNDTPLVATDRDLIMQALHKTPDYDYRRRAAIMHVLNTGTQYQYPHAKKGYRVEYKGKTYKNFTALCNEYGVCPKKCWNIKDQYGIDKMEAFADLVRR